MLRVYLELGKFQEVGIETSEIIPLIRNWTESPAMTEWLTKRGFNINNAIEIIEDLESGKVHFKQLREKRKKTVLIVDDDAALREVLRFSFETKGYQVFESGSVKEAMAQLRRLDMTETIVDLAVIDYSMPGPNGLKLVEFLKRNYADTKSIIFSGGFDTPTSVPVFQKGSSGIIEKSDDIVNYDPAIIRKMKREIDSKFGVPSENILKDYSGQKMPFEKIIHRKIQDRLDGMIDEMFLADNETKRKEKWEEIKSKAKLFNQDLDLKEIMARWRKGQNAG